MQPTQSRPTLSWRDGQTPVSDRFEDPYYALSDGAAEAAHVFLAGNGLPGRLCKGFAIAELGFGTGLNLCVTARACQIPIRYTSFEAFPMSAADTARALARWPDLRAEAQALVAALERGEKRFEVGSVDVSLIIGDARKTLPAWSGQADAWYLDGFSPARNPELWEQPLMRAVADHTAPGGSFATYTAAGHVRRALAAAGFAVERHPGFGHKRHMSCGALA